MAMNPTLNMKQVTSFCVILFVIVSCKSEPNTESESKTSFPSARSEQMTTSDGSTFKSPSFTLVYVEEQDLARLLPSNSYQNSVNMVCDGGLFRIGSATCTDQQGNHTFKAVRPASLGTPHSAISASISWQTIPANPGNNNVGSQPTTVSLSGKYVHQLACGELNIEFTSATEFHGMRYCGIGGYYSGTYTVNGDQAILTDNGYATTYFIRGNTLVFDDGNGYQKVYEKR